MKIEVISAAQLTAKQAAAWSGLQRGDGALQSPYFRPEFTQAVASVREDVEIGLLEDAGELAGFFPFQRKGRIAGPVGGRMSDFHGPITRSDVAWDAEQLVRGCGLSAWHFDHLPACQTPFRPYHWTTGPSPYIDLAQGWARYQAAQSAQHKETFKGMFRKLRRAEREWGPARLELHSTDPTVFETLLRWKRQQYRRTCVTDFLAFDWTVALLERVLAEQGEGFSGMLSALYFGDTLAAVLLSMRSHETVHAWFSAHGPDQANVSPGLLLWLEFARGCEPLGIRRIDLGKGPELYKTHFMSGATELAEGSVDLRPVASLVRRNWHRVCAWTRRSALRRPLLAPARMIRRMVESRIHR